MPAFDHCVPAANIHIFPQENHPCGCGLHPNLVTAQMTMESVKNNRRQCMISGCKPGAWAKPDLPECEWQLVQKCNRCLRTMNDCCQCPHICDAHGLARKA